MVISFLIFSLLGLVLGLGNTVGYHRLLAHRAFRTSPALKRALALVGALHSGPPLLWVGIHRLHHLDSDGPGDPHSPRDRGFWHAHTGWLLGPLDRGRAAPVFAAAFALSGFGQQARTVFFDVSRLVRRGPQEWRQVTRDLAEDPFLLFLDQPLVTPALFAGQVVAAWLLGGVPALALLWLLHLLLTNASWAVNSVSHGARFGRQDHDTGDGSRNVPWLAAITLGEGWHNNHHRWPKSARHAPPGSYDPSWWTIRALVAAGLASEPWLPRSRSESTSAGPRPSGSS